MGYQLALRLLNVGYDLAAYNRTRAKCEPLTEFGAKIVDTPADLADRDIVFIMVSADQDLEAVISGPGGLLTGEDKPKIVDTPADLADRDIVFIMVSADQDLEAVISGPGGLLTGEDKPKIVVDSSTVSTEASAKVRGIVEAAGAQFVAAPVSGNPKVIAAGKLTVAASGPRSAFDEVEPLLARWGRGVTYVGEGEVARLVKIAHNVFLGVVIQSLAEITVLAERGGVSRAAFLQFLNDSVLGSAFSRYKSPALVNLDFHPTFTSVLLRKDLQLGLSAGKELGVPMPLAAATDMLIAQAIGAGYTAEDFATLVLEQARRSGYAIEAENVPVDDGLAPEEA
jgi:3-hydroxyisobutyrate dehydrogenase-like beta-hydroxyacid dehydrogenase